MAHDEILNCGRDDDALFIDRDISEDNTFERELSKSQISWYLGKIKTLFCNFKICGSPENINSGYLERLELYREFEHGFYHDFLPEQHSLLKGPLQAPYGNGEP